LRDAWRSRHCRRSTASFEWLTFQAILLSRKVPSWGVKLIVPAVGAMLALSAALAAACFVKAFGVSFLGRPRTTMAATAQEVDRWSLAAMFIFTGRVSSSESSPARFIDALAPVSEHAGGRAHAAASADPWLSIVPIAESRAPITGSWSSVFITVSTFAAIQIIHRFASRAVRRGPAWDCGFPDPSPATQYTGGGFAQPIRRVFGKSYSWRATGEMPPPGDLRAARLTVTLRDLVWDVIYAPVAGAIWLARRQTQPSAVPTIRKYLSLVFALLVNPPVLPHACDAGMVLNLRFSSPRRADAARARPRAAAPGLHAQGQARLLRRQGPPILQPTAICCALIRKEVVLAENASWLFRSGPYMIFAATWWQPRWSRLSRPDCSSADRRPDCDHRAYRFVAILPALVGMDVGTAFGGIGSSREMMFASLAEPAMMMIRVHACAHCRLHSALGGGRVHADECQPALSLGLALIALIIVALAENARIPVDNPATHLELTMVHEAMVLEYSGRHLAVLELAAALKLLLYLSLIACIFMPWGIAPAGGGPAAYATGLASFLAKIAVGGFALALFETSIAKMRVFRVPDFLALRLMLGLLGCFCSCVTDLLMNSPRHQRNAQEVRHPEHAHLGDRGLEQGQRKAAHGNLCEKACQAGRIGRRPAARRAIPHGMKMQAMSER